MSRKLFFHLTASGFFTSLCLSALSITTDIVVLKVNPNIIQFMFLFFATFLYYNYHKISWYGHVRMYDKQNLKYQWPAQHPTLLLLGLSIGFAGCIALFNNCIDTLPKLMLVLIAALIAFFYNRSFSGIQLRKIRGMKAFAIAAVSIILGVLLPYMNSNKLIDNNFAFYSVYAFAQFLFITSLCIASDIRDIREDREDKIKTFAVIAGVHFSKRIAILLLLCHLALMLLLNQAAAINLQHFELFLLIDLLAMLLFYRLNEKHGYYYFTLLIDGLLLLQSVGVLMLKWSMINS